MKETVLITVSYIIEIETHDFWNSDTGYLRVETENSLKERFPKKIKITDNNYAKGILYLTFQLVERKLML